MRKVQQVLGLAFLAAAAVIALGPGDLPSTLCGDVALGAVYLLLRMTLAFLDGPHASRVQCDARNPFTGERCGLWAVSGSAKCRPHGGGSLAPGGVTTRAGKLYVIDLDVSGRTATTNPNPSCRRMPPRELK